MHQCCLLLHPSWYGMWALLGEKVPRLYDSKGASLAFHSVWFCHDGCTPMKQKTQLGFQLVMGNLAEIFQPRRYAFNKHLILISCQTICYTPVCICGILDVSNLSALTCSFFTELKPIQGCNWSNFGWGEPPPLLSSQWDGALQVPSSLPSPCASHRVLGVPLLCAPLTGRGRCLRLEKEKRTGPAPELLCLHCQGHWEPRAPCAKEAQRHLSLPSGVGWYHEPVVEALKAPHPPQQAEGV